MTRDGLHLGVPVHGILGVLAVLLAVVAARVPRARVAALALWVPLVVGLVLYPAFRAFDRPLLGPIQLAAFERKEYLALAAVVLASAGVAVGRLGFPAVETRFLWTAALFSMAAAFLGIYTVWS